jgi:hypothetical protein
VVLPGRYVDDWSASLAAGRVRNQKALVDHATRLAARIGSLLDCGAAPLILGGDCSVLVGVGVACLGGAGTGSSTSMATLTFGIQETPTTGRASLAKTLPPLSGGTSLR